MEKVMKWQKIAMPGWSRVIIKRLLHHLILILIVYTEEEEAAHAERETNNTPRKEGEEMGAKNGGSGPCVHY